ncbi:MAG: glutathione peroxidase [Hyphomonadaceae bacterium]|nr:glutathione peroxidase [Hyphomonadaceae bacterium]
MSSVYAFEATSLEGKPTTVGEHRGKVMLIVNVASKCGFTYQYEGLEALYRKYKERGFVVAGFPCNQFKKQEPGDAREIRDFCSLTYDVSFPMYAKIDVNGPGAHPLYRWLKRERRGAFGTQSIKWNFTKFLIDREGNVKARYAPTKKPQALEGAIEALL